MKNSRKLLFSGMMLGVMLFLVSPCQSQQINSQSEWPEITMESKPWSRWWWMGSAVDEVNLMDLISKYNKAGFGGLEITPIYGAVGYEKTYLSFLSPGWMKMLDVSVREARKNNMGIDMNTGTGWPFGGPQISRQAAASKLIIQKYVVSRGERLQEKLTPSDTRQVEAGAHLQAVISYSQDGKILDLTRLVDAAGTLQWQAESSDYEIYAAFSGKTMQKVKRAAPGGEGLTFDHFSKEALNLYLTRFDSAFQKDNHGVRTFFNDSYEVYGTNWSESIFDEFLKRRGYSLKSYLRELSEKNPQTEISRRVQSDYRETLSDMLLENFTRTWTGWANNKGSRTRNQAHGSPGNLLDLYAAVDIPECETFGSSKFDIPGLRRDSADIRNVDPDPAMMKFASSAAHVSGKNLTSCETFTWLAEHFRVSLSQCKPEVEQAFLAGVNHVFYHGTAYSPAKAGWPGWLFYASVNFAPANSFWSHVNGLNEYIARCQTILQSGVSYNDLLVYWPVYDVWNMPESTDLLLTIHSIDKWLYPTPFCKDVKELCQKGFSLDYVSDRLLDGLSVKNGVITTRSGSTYRALVVPATRYMPVETVRKIMEMATLGAEIIFEKLPEDVPGMTNLEANRIQQKELLNSIQFQTISEKIKSAKIGKGGIMQANQLQDALGWKNIRREKLSDTGLKYIRRKSERGVYYYLVNHSAVSFDGFLPLNENGNGCLLLDPQSGLTGMAQTVKEKDQMKVRLQLRPGEAMFVLVSGDKLTSQSWKYLEKPLRQIPVTGPWKLEFTEGGAAMPAKSEIKDLISWTELPDPNAKNYSGLARYKTNFEITGNLGGEFILDPGKVCESARVWVNGKDAGILWSIPFIVKIGGFIKPGINTIEIEVANLMANRITNMDQQKIPWRNYHEINFVNIDYKSFDASAWKIMPSGLLGPVTITQWQLN